MARERQLELAAQPQALTVSQLTSQIAQQLQSRFENVWVEGEASNPRFAGAGHCYFDLKDGSALIGAVIWKSALARVLRFKLETGAQVLVRGSISVYAPSGRYSLVVDRIEPKGAGAMQKRYEELKKKLASEGLFDELRKRPIPFLPRRIGVVTAKEGAAVRDILHTILDRFPRASVVLRPSRVQGEGAAAEIAQAIADLNELSDVDVLIVGRGGGSLEDLWAFNEEIVARAIAGSRIPVISAVGHEIDYTIADFVADLRAKTPTDAGTLVVPSLEELEETLADRRGRLILAARSQWQSLQERVRSQENHWVFRSLRDRVEGLRAQLASELETLQSRFAKSFRTRQDCLSRLAERLSRMRPDARLARQQGRIFEFWRRLDAAGQRALAEPKRRYAVLAERLEGRSPVAILARGYSIARKEGEARFLTDVNRLKPGDTVETKLQKGRFFSRVERIDPREGAG